MHDYYADYDDYDSQYYDDAAGYDPPEASYGTYDSELSYELEPDIDYSGDEYESEVVEQASWDEPRYAPHHSLYGSEDIVHGCVPQELEDASFDVLALDKSYAAWQETWATGPAADEDEDAWAQAMDSWREQIEASHGADASEDLVYTSLPNNKLVVGDDLWTSPERDQLQEAFERGGISDEEYVRVLGELWDEQLELKQLDDRLRADGYVWDEECDDYVHPVYGYASLEPDGEGVALPLTPPDHMCLIHSVTPPPPPPPPVIPVPVRTSRPSYRLARGPRLGPLKPSSAIHLLRTPQSQTQHTRRRRQRRLRTHSPPSRVRNSPRHPSTAASRARARSDPGPRPGKLKPPDARMIIATVPTPILSIASMLPKATPLQARASPHPIPLCVDTAVISKSRKPPNIGEIFWRAVPLSATAGAPPSPLSSSSAPISELDQRRRNALRRLSKRGMTPSPRGVARHCLEGEVVVPLVLS